MLLLLLCGPLALLAQAIPGAPAGQRAMPEYRIGPGDELSVTFPFNPELNHDGPVGPDGRFALPFAGNLLLAGETVPESTREVAAALRDAHIVADAHPSLTVRKYGAVVYVGGEVKLPGIVTLTTGMDPLQAVLAAGGLLDTAKTRRIVIVRRGSAGQAQLQYVDLRSYMRGKTTYAPGLLEARDVVFVPKTSIAEADRWVEQYLNKLLPFGKSLNYNFGNYGTTAVAR